MEAFFQHKDKSRLTVVNKLDYPAHLHRAVEFGYLKAGESLLTVEGKSYSLKAGDAFVIFPDRVHLFEQSASIDGYLAIARTEELVPFEALFSQNAALCPVLSAEMLKSSGISELFACAAEDKDVAQTGVLQGYLSLILGKLLPLLTQGDATLSYKGEARRVLAYLQKNYRENLSRSDLARALGISESTLSHFFSSVMHVSLPRYLTMLRLEEAQRLLGETELSVTAVAARAGFSSLRSFNRAFREVLGQSPSALRRQKQSRSRES